MLGRFALALGKHYEIPKSPSWDRARRLWRNRKGGAAIEFGLVAPLFILIIVGITEVGTTLFVGALMEGAVRDASRYGITGQDGPSRAQVIQDIIAERTIGLVDINVAEIKTQVYESFEAVGAQEPYTDDSPANGVYDVGEDFVDVNLNGIWDHDQGKEGVGEAGEIVLYEINYSLPLLTSYLADHFGSGGSMGLSASIAVLNEPYIDDPSVQ